MADATTRTIRGVCPHDCPDACGWVVTVRDGRAVRLAGDPGHPMTRGFLCQKVARYLERVYHADRLTTPLRRVGPKGSGKFRDITWDEAIAEVANRFQSLVDSPDGPQSILPYSYGGTMGEIQSGSLDRRFFHRIGASLLDRTICATAGTVGCDLTLGTRAFVDPFQVVNAKLILNWGSNTSVTNSHLWALMHEARKTGAVIVTIDPYRSPTAARSDWWIPIRPGTDAALALGMMNVIFRDGLQDQDYIDRYCLGGQELREHVLNNYPLPRVASITGLSENDIEKLARMYATDNPTFLRLNYGLQRHRGGGMAVRTVCCLPSVTGAWKYPGGGALLSTSKNYPWNRAALQRPDLSPPGTRTINMVQLAEALLGELPGPPVRSLYVYNANPASVNPDQNRIIRGLLREDLFTIVHDQFLTDTARYSDIVLPATTQFEHFDILGSYGHLFVQTNEKAIDPIGESKPNTEVFRLLAQAMNLEPELFEITDEGLADIALSGTGAMAGMSRESLRHSGPKRLQLPDMFQPFAEGGFPTPSGKCEFVSDRSAALGFNSLPDYVPPAEDPQTKPELARRFPLQLVTPPLPAILNSTFANVPSLREAAGPQQIELSRSDAESRGLREAMVVRVFNDRGAFQARLSISENVSPGTAVSLGCRWAVDMPDGRNVNATTATTLTDFGGGATFFDNLVQVEEFKPDREASR
ncbi:MAG: molybdopterin oxidoreductase family protein [Gemmataceae bacterium]|nr:molybdopterin oxidoreductase family protein [Gemmataceae bacterium]